MFRRLLMLACVLAFSLAASDTPDLSAELKNHFSGSNAPPFAKLRETYLNLQQQRVLQEIPAPPRMGRKGEKIEKTTLGSEEVGELQKWFAEKPKFRDAFLLALVPGMDDYGAAARIALKLRAAQPKEHAAFENLLIAFAVVWDNPRSQQQSHVFGVPELYKKPTPVPSPEESFSWYVANAPRLDPGMKSTPWRLLKYLANDALPLEERNWLQKKYPGFNLTLGTEYSKIDYDKSKLTDNIGRLGSNEYTLDNLCKFGGVCRDQAFYARSACRAFGMPAYFATGESNTDGLHAWVGWIVKEGPAYKLMSHGRYAYDKYFTADIIDPQSGQHIHDYLVGIECKALSNEAGYNDAEVNYRVWKEVGESLEPQDRTALLIEALKKNPFHRPAWLAIGDATADGSLPRASGEKQWTYLQANYKDYPDFVFSMTRTFSRMFKTAAERYTFYETSAKFFRDIKRQDLVAKLRIEEVAMCTEENRKDLAAQVASAATVECAGEGEQGAQLAKSCAKLFKELNQPQAAVKPLQTALKGMMKIRADRVNPHWIAVNETLRDLHKDLGDTKAADAIQAELDRTRKNVK